FGGTLSAFGTPSQKKAYLPDLVKGRIIGTAAAYESETGSDILSMQATAVLRDDVWILNGNKSFVVNASIADVFLVYAATAPPSGDGPSVTCFIVNKGAPGMEIGAEYETMGFRGVPICDVVFKDCEVTGDMVLGDRNAGGEIFRQAAEAGKTGAAVCSLGIAAACLEEASGHSKRRRSFGRLINRYQEVAFKLSDMVIMTDLSRLLIYKALRARETGDPEADVLASCAKVFAAESATRAADYAMQIFGGHGYLKGGPVERLYRNAKLGELIDGTSEIHRVFIAGRLVERFG
ncbi:MAG: acyl-CoA dehydrogenase, partial [Spirochaetota bacterium]|nr:acyl-CoA dehydrogenase [Spirochaetota bacterium]